MKITGERITLTKWVEAGGLAVAVDLEAVLPIDDPSEPCFEPGALEFLHDVRLHAEAGDREWLRKVGRVYVLESAA